MHNKKQKDQAAYGTDFLHHANTQEISKKPRKTEAQKEQELRDKLTKMQAKLHKIESAKKEKHIKKLDKLWPRMRHKIVSLGLEDVPPEAFEKLLSDNAQHLRDIVAKTTEAAR
jgi:hypothetical protein